MEYQEVKKMPPKELANKIFYDHYNMYAIELDIFFSTLLAKRNSMLYICTIIEKLESDKDSKAEDYFYYINTKLELELI